MSSCAILSSGRLPISHNTHALLVFEGDVPGAALHGFGLGLDAAEALSMGLDESPVGFSWIHLRIPTARLLREDAAPAVLEWLRSWLLAGVKAGASVGFVTRFDDFTDVAYLESSLPIGLLAEDDDIVDAGWDWVVLGHPVRAHLTLDADWVETSRTDQAALYHRRNTADLWLS